MPLAHWASELGIHPQATVEVIPPCAGFVGSDLLAGVLATRLTDQPGGLLIDFGTNSEMALWDGRTLWITSAAGGPAFETSQVQCGMPAEPGAIYRVDRPTGLRRAAIPGDRRGASQRALRFRPDRFDRLLARQRGFDAHRPLLARKVSRKVSSFAKRVRRSGCPTWTWICFSVRKRRSGWESRRCLPAADGRGEAEPYLRGRGFRPAHELRQCPSRRSVAGRSRFARGTLWKHGLGGMRVVAPLAGKSRGPGTAPTADDGH